MSYECSCDYEPAEYASKRSVKAARKQYSCDECPALIRPGEPYTYIHGKWDGYHATFRTCRHCQSLLEWARISVPCFCWGYGNLLQDIADMVGEVRRDVPGFFFEYGRRVITIRRQRAAESEGEPA